MLTREEKEKIIQDFSKHNGDTGSAEVQIALLTARIKYLTEHMKMHRNDVHSKLGLISLVSKRTKLLKYLAKSDVKSYREVVQKLNLRK
ncbi:MAG: 30S ribosomal protein S15 [Planctomycetota bacterium]